MAERDPQRRRKWVRHEREYSNSMWHTDFKLLPDGRWFLCYEDDASRFVTGYGAFAEATTAHALEVLEGAIRKHGKPASIMTDRGSQFYASQKETAKRGDGSEFEKRLVELGIRQILAGVHRPQTSSKLGRLHGEIQRKLHRFEDTAGPPGTAAPIGDGGAGPDPLDRFMKWYNYWRPHMSLDWDRRETPAQAFERKMPPPPSPGGKVADVGSTAEGYDAG